MPSQEDWWITVCLVSSHQPYQHGWTTRRWISCRLCSKGFLDTQTPTSPPRNLDKVVILWEEMREKQAFHDLLFGLTVWLCWLDWLINVFTDCSAHFWMLLEDIGYTQWLFLLLFWYMQVPCLNFKTKCTLLWVKVKDGHTPLLFITARKSGTAWRITCHSGGISFTFT